MRPSFVIRLHMQQDSNDIFCMLSGELIGSLKLSLT